MTVIGLLLLGAVAIVVWKITTSYLLNRWIHGDAVIVQNIEQQVHVSLDLSKVPWKDACIYSQQYLLLTLDDDHVLSVNTKPSVLTTPQRNRYHIHQLQGLTLQGDDMVLCVSPHHSLDGKQGVAIRAQSPSALHSMARLCVVFTTPVDVCVRYVYHR